MEESDSGLFHHLGKVAYSKGYREFESLLLRNYKIPPFGGDFVCGGEEVPCGTSVRDSKDFSLTSRRVRKVPADVIGESLLLFSSITLVTRIPNPPLRHPFLLRYCKTYISL